MPNCLEFRTVQASAFKTLIETLKELLTDTVIEATPSGLKVIAVDAAHVVLVHLRLDASRFEYYACARPSLHLAVNMLNLYKLVKTLGNSDTLTVYVDTEDMNHLVVQIDNNEKNTQTVYRLNMLDMDNVSIEVPAEQFDDIIVLNSGDFQKLCRDMLHIAEKVEIKVVRGEVTFSCKGDFCTQETTFSSECLRDTGAEVRAERQDRIVQGIFPLKYLVIFTRCTNLSDTVELYFKNSYPLVVRYNVSTLGEIKLVCAQLVRD